jgi:hypothetical protein
MEKIFFKCQGEVATDMWHPHKCGQRASIERDGKWYCKRHDPIAMKAKYDEKNKAWTEKFQKDMREALRARAAVASVENLVKAVNLVLALDGEPTVYACSNPNNSDPGWVVRLDPKAREQLESAVKTYEDMLKG